MTLGELKARMSMREMRQWEQQFVFEAQQEAKAQAAQRAAEKSAQGQRQFRG